MLGEKGASRAFFCAVARYRALLPHERRLVTLGRRRKNNYSLGGEMKNPLDSLWGTVISGLVLTLILYNVIKFALQQ
jgi:hypothetical protein